MLYLAHLFIDVVDMTIANCSQSATSTSKRITDMKPQTTSLELSKRMKEAGIVQESYFIYVETKHGTQVYPASRDFELDRYGSVQRICSAYTATEILDRLPNFIVVIKGKHKKDGWHCVAVENPLQLNNVSRRMFIKSHDYIQPCHGKTSAEALGEMELYLKNEQLT